MELTEESTQTLPQAAQVYLLAVVVLEALLPMAQVVISDVHLVIPVAVVLDLALLVYPVALE